MNYSEDKAKQMILGQNAKSLAAVSKSSEALSNKFQKINNENEKNTSEANANSCSDKLIKLFNLIESDNKNLFPKSIKKG
ncbi:hypothetical protein RclHR1_15840003 [Rhizophagus clarus]|nr:hypothetical protein RclHR1_15840003 [Rhizophagus clarus]